MVVGDAFMVFGCAFDVGVFIVVVVVVGHFKGIDFGSKIITGIRITCCGQLRCGTTFFTHTRTETIDGITATHIAAASATHSAAAHHGQDFTSG